MNNSDLAALIGNTTTDTTNKLAKHYSQFKVTERILLTGHSHQAWPDAAFEGQKQAWLDAASFVDNKWGNAFEKAEKLKRFYADRLGDTYSNNYALASNTHDLIVRFLSALNWNKKKNIVTTDGEFHSMRRQLNRLAEEQVELTVVPTSPIETLTQRLADKITDATAAVMLSSVMFKDASIVPHLDCIAEATTSQNVPLLVDAYHATNVVPFSISENKLEQAYIVGGGYKYCQFGEGNCFIRVPPDCNDRPVVTGWYAEFSELEKTVAANQTPYPKAGDRYQGSTYDPTSHYRAASVIDFFQEQHLDVHKLRAISQYQLGFMRDAFDDLDCDPAIISRADVALESIGGFLSLKTERSAELQTALMERGIWTDQRDHHLRLGPAPYLSLNQLSNAMKILGELI